MDRLQFVYMSDVRSVIHARWLECEDGWGDCHYQCSECGCEWCLNDGTPEENGMKFCPNCGAQMDGEQREAIPWS